MRPLGDGPEVPEEIDARVLEFLGVFGHGYTRAKLELEIGDGVATHYSVGVSVQLRRGRSARPADPSPRRPLVRELPGWSEAQQLVRLTKQWDPSYRDLTHGCFQYEVRDGHVKRILGTKSSLL